MSIPVLIQTYDEVRRLAIAGSVVALQKQLGTLVAASLGTDWPKQTPRIRFPIGGGDGQNGDE